MNVLSTVSTYLCLYMREKSWVQKQWTIGLYTYTLAQSTSNVFDRLFILSFMVFNLCLYVDVCCCLRGEIKIYIYLLCHRTRSTNTIEHRKSEKKTIIINDDCLTCDVLLHDSSLIVFVIQPADMFLLNIHVLWCLNFIKVWVLLHMMWHRPTSISRDAVIDDSHIGNRASNAEHRCA